MNNITKNSRFCYKCVVCVIFIAIIVVSCHVSQDHAIISYPYLTVINGNSETLSFIPSYGDNLVRTQIQTGQSPNQILRNNDDIYIVNSLSNSIIVYNIRDFTIKHEFSTGKDTNPYKMTIYNNKIYVTAYILHQILVFDSNGNKLKTIELSRNTQGGVTYYPYPQWIETWSHYAFVACMDAKANGATNANPSGSRVAVIDLDTDTVTGYINIATSNTNKVVVDGNCLYVISSGSYNSSFDENGTIMMIMLDTAMLSSPNAITATCVAQGASFGAFCIQGNVAYCGHLGNGVLVKLDVTTTPWTDIATREFTSNYGLAYIPDIIYDNDNNALFVTEFNSNKLYQLEPDSLDIVKEWSSSSCLYGDAQFMMMIK